MTKATTLHEKLEHRVTFKEATRNKIYIFMTLQRVSTPRLGAGDSDHCNILNSRSSLFQFATNIKLRQNSDCDVKKSCHALPPLGSKLHLPRQNAYKEHKYGPVFESQQ